MSTVTVGYRRQVYLGPVKARVALLGASCSTTDGFLNAGVLKGIGSAWWAVSGSSGPVATCRSLRFLLTLLPVPFDERRIHLPFDEARVIEDLFVQRNRRLNPLDQKLGQS